jgi:hypothetical protein
LNIDGPFRLINALRKIEPGDTAPIKLAFKPSSTIEVCLINKENLLFIFFFFQQFLETLELTSESSKLTLCLKGKSIYIFNYLKIYFTRFWS